MPPPEKQRKDGEEINISGLYGLLGDHTAQEAKTYPAGWSIRQQSMGGSAVRGALVTVRSGGRGGPYAGVCVHLLPLTTERGATARRRRPSSSTHASAHSISFLPSAGTAAAGRWQLSPPLPIRRAGCIRGPEAGHQQTSICPTGNRGCFVAVASPPPGRLPPCVPLPPPLPSPPPPSSLPQSPPQGCSPAPSTASALWPAVATWDRPCASVACLLVWTSRTPHDGPLQTRRCLRAMRRAPRLGSTS